MPELKTGDDHVIHYQFIEGDSRRVHLVYLHEGLGCTAMWEDFPTLLCEMTGCPGLLYDRLGYGKSSPLNRLRTIHYLHQYAIEELSNFLDEIIPDSPFILIGHSDGGSISLIFGAERSPRLKGIITEAAHVFVEPATIAGIKIAKQAWNEGKLTGLAKYHGEKTESIFKAWSETWLKSWFKHWNIEYLLPSVEVPLLAIQGRDDPYGSIDQVNSIVSGSSGYADHRIIDNAGHCPHKEAQSIVLQLMADFITQINQDVRNSYG